VRGEVVGQGGELGGIAAEAFHLVDGQDDPAVRGVGLDLPGERERLLEFWADPDRVLTFSANTLSGSMPCAASASSWVCSSWVRVLHRAYPIRMSALGVSEASGAGGGVPGRQG
jgi:hypothetical protein